jgi:hypothetical protein
MPRTKQYASDVRRRAKRAEVRPEHGDRYAHKRVDPNDRRMAELLADLAEHFNTAEERRS